MKEAADKVKSQLKLKGAGGAGKKRRTAGWTLLTLGVLVAVAWVVLRWWKLVIFYDGVGVVLDCGALDVSRSEAYGMDKTLLWARTRAPQWDLWTGFVSERTYDQRTLAAGVFYYSFTPAIGSWMMHMLIWPIPFLLWTPAALLLRSGIVARRRANKGACPRCGYSLAGLGHGEACPECGGGGRE